MVCGQSGRLNNDFFSVFKGSKYFFYVRHLTWSLSVQVWSILMLNYTGYFSIVVQDSKWEHQWCKTHIFSSYLVLAEKYFQNKSCTDFGCITSTSVAWMSLLDLEHTIIVLDWNEIKKTESWWVRKGRKNRFLISQSVCHFLFYWSIHRINCIIWYQEVVFLACVHVIILFAITEWCNHAPCNQLYGFYAQPLFK